MAAFDPLTDGFFARYRPLAVRFATGLVGGEEVAEDLFQEVACGLVARVRAGRLVLESEQHARNYLLRALRNRATDRARRAPGRPHALDAETEASLASDAPGPDELVARVEAALEDERRLAHVGRVVAGLPLAQREALRLRFVEGLSYREMAERSGTARATLQDRVEAALTKIRARSGRPGGRA